LPKGRNTKLQLLIKQQRAQTNDITKKKSASTSAAKLHPMRLQLFAVKLSQVIYSFLVKPNRMFVLVEASAWSDLCNRKRAGASLFAYFLFW